jgi:tetratricopeptide (TPR) repeat protein
MKKALQKIEFFFFLVLILAGCGTRTVQPQKTERVSAQSDSTIAVSGPIGKALADFNHGAALLEQYNFLDAAKAFESVLKTAPDWTAARFNLGLAYFNMQEKEGAQDYLELAKKAFDAVLETDPNNLHARFCLGLYYQHLGENEKALECFDKVYEADSKDPYVLYKYAEALINTGSADKGTEMLQKVIALDPGFISAVYRLAIQYQRTQKRDQAKALFARFQELKETELTGGTFTVLKAYGTIGKYYMALGAENLPLPVTTAPQTRILFSPELKTFSNATSAWKSPWGDVILSGIAAGDIDEDGDIDLCITAFGDDGGVWLWRNDGTGRFSHDAMLAQEGISPCFGDVDNDGDLDLWLGRAGPDIYFQNDGKANFTPEPNETIAGGECFTHYARLLDADSDGDLDFLAFSLADKIAKPAAGSLYNNNRDGSFVDIAEKLGLKLKNNPVNTAVYDDFDNDRDLDLVIFSMNGKTIGWVNDRGLKYHVLDAATTGLNVNEVLSATSGDPDKDGDRDLLIFTNNGPQLFINQGGFTFKRQEYFSHSFGRLRGTVGQFADMDNDGDLDIVIADAIKRDGGQGPALLINNWPEDHFIDVLQVDPGNMLSAINFPGNASCIAADFTGNGNCDILLAPIGEKPFLVENITPGGHWIEIDLRGMREQDKKTRSNNSAIGARVEVKTGSVFQQYMVGTSSGQAAMPPYRIHAGLGQYSKVDWLRIMWPDAVLQAELELPADQVIKITELQRKTSSCPHLFAWDGTHFEFVSDFGGMGGIGYLATPGEYAKPDPTEYLPVPDIKPRDGEFVFQVLEPIEEVVYFDHAKLIAVDHPAGTQVYPNEMMAIGIDPVPFELFCFKDAIEPVRAVDDSGADVTEKIRSIDRRYAGATKPDPRFVGLAKEHFVKLDFGDRLEALSPQSRLVLFLNGWVEYPYSSTNYAASQAGLSCRAPSIHVFRNGKWLELFHEVGYPAGIRHTMTLDVTGKILPGDKRIRISTNMEIYWDQIFMAPVLDGSVLRTQELPVKNADLHFLGYPQEYSPDGRLPTLYDYDNISGAVAWKIMEGDYTRYGDVTELLDEADDCYVIMGRGEELTLRFSAGDFSPIPNGFSRSFILKTDSYCKDMDLYSAYPDTVEPLPFHSMSTYPYGADEKYPDDQKRREYRRRFNTRRIGNPNMK